MAMYKTTPPDTDKMPPGIPYIIGNEAAERFSYYGMRTILTVFMFRYLHLMSETVLPAMSKAEAQEHYHTFSSWVYFFPIVGAILSDAVTGKYRIIMAVSVLYCLGHLALAFMGGASLSPEQWMWLGLFLIALGSGGIKPCVSAHVGDQFGSRNQHLMEKVYQWFYFSINFGSTLSTILTPWLLEWYGPHVAFGVPGVLMAIATLMFWLGRNTYIHVPAGGLAFLKEVFSRNGLLTILRLGSVYLVIAVFWALFDQTSSAWVLQAEDMNLQWLGIEWLPSQIQVLNPLLVMAMIPLFQFVVYPAINSVFRLTPLRKIGIGLFVMVAGFGLSAIVQGWIDDGSRPSVAWQFLGYVIVTAAEIMISITGLEFSYAQAPKTMKSVIMAVWLFSVSLGNFVTAAVNHAIQVPSINPIVAEAGTLDATERGGSDTLADRTIRVVDVEPRKSWATADEATVVRTIRLAGGDGSFDTPDDVLLSFNRFASLVGVDTQEDPALAAAKEKIDTAFFRSADNDATKELPSDETGLDLLAGVTDSAGNPIGYHRITRDRYRLVADGPDGARLTPDDIVLSATVVRADVEEAARMKDKPLTWREKRIIELRGEEGRLQVEAERGQAPETRIDADTSIGGLVTLEGADYFWFWTGCMAAAGVIFIPVALLYRDGKHLQSGPQTEADATVGT
ncbi:MAG: POT family MFS transporter [Pirellulales bacterium]|nr:POT family MFS transporter [Pirellulales bacterium]